MTPPPESLNQEARACWYRVRIARARLLFQIARDDAALGDLLQFARVVGDESAADSVAAFRAQQEDALQAAQAELDRLQHA